MNDTIRISIAAGCVALTGFSTSALAQDSMQDTLLNTLDDLLYTAESIQMAPEVQAQILVTREQIQLADPAGFETLPDTLRTPLQLLELSSAQMRLNYEFEPEVPGRSKAVLSDMKTESLGADYDGGALDQPSYPNIPWSFSFSDPGEPDEGEHGGSGSGSGFCAAPGYSVQTRFITTNIAVTLTAIKDIAEQGCNQSGLGFNASLACIVTDIAAFVAIGAETNQELCNDAMTAAEVTASWEGLNTVHENLQHVHDDLAAHDADIKADVAEHDSDVKTLLDEVLAKQGEMLGNQATIIQLLNTPAGRRPDWND